MKIDYAHAKKLCTANEFSLLVQCKPKTLTKFTEQELKLKIKQARKIADKWRDQSRSQGGSSRSGEKQGLFSEAVDRLETRLARKQNESAPPGGKKRKPRGFPPIDGGAPSGPQTLSLKQQAKQNAILSGQRIEASGLDSRIRGHVSARGRRHEAAREARNG